MTEEANGSEAENTPNTASECQPLLPAGLAMPNPLKTEGNLASNWKKFKRKQQRSFLASARTQWKFLRA
jgi:hypothetical protein